MGVHQIGTLRPELVVHDVRLYGEELEKFGLHLWIGPPRQEPHVHGTGGSLRIARDKAHHALGAAEEISVSVRAVHDGPMEVVVAVEPVVHNAEGQQEGDRHGQWDHPRGGRGARTRPGKQPA